MAQLEIPPIPSNPRFTLELEFVLSLANPHYLSHLAVTYPNLLGISSSSSSSGSASYSYASNSLERDNPSEIPEARAFAAYLAYLYDYWRRPEYVQFLTHPGATLRALRLLQEESFRKAIIRPQVIEALLGAVPENEESENQQERE
ncbi:suppressor of hpr1 [Myotisia sp. PD_48]|nr:suppressor of hpr1 [Myotisia sp. PD_48]